MRGSSAQWHVYVGTIECFAMSPQQLSTLGNQTIKKTECTQALDYLIRQGFEKRVPRIVFTSAAGVNDP